MKSILFLSLMNGASWGGSEEIWYKVALYASQKGWNVGCAAYDWEEKQEKFNTLRKSGCIIYPIPNKGRKKRNLIERLRYKLTKIQQRKYCKTLPFNQYDIVIVNLGGFEVYSKQWRFFYKNLKKYALVYHNYDEQKELRGYKAIALKEWISRAHNNLFVAGRIKIVLEKQLQISIHKACIIINPITFLPPTVITPFPPLHKGSYIFVVMAALDTSRKAQDNLIEALSFPKWKERDWMLYLFGEGGDEHKLQILIDRTQTGDKIFLKGHTEDVKAALQNAHLVLQMTHRDAMPISVVEGMAMSRPIVASNIGDMPIWVEQNVNGWISKNASPEEIDKTLEMAWDKREQWEEMGKASFNIFKEKYPDSPEEYFLEQLKLR